MTIDSKNHRQHSGHRMSLKFGIHLVEQRIISPEQFCGLVKIQQEATVSPAALVIRLNILTIKQVAHVLDIAEANPKKTFVQIAMELDLMDRADADQVLHHQQLSCPTIRKLVVECDLLTHRQTSVLFLHFERNGSNVTYRRNSKDAVDSPTSRPAVGPRQPKFKQRPVVIRSSTTSVNR